MKMMTRGLVVGAAAMVLGACTSISSVSQMQPTGSEFTRALHAGYSELAEKEAGFYDWIDAWHFADLAEMSANGTVVQPADPANWTIQDADGLAEITAGRARLMDALNAGARESHPDLAAHAQVKFDCWVEEQEEGPIRTDRGVASHQERELAKCRSEFLTAMDELEAAMRPEVMIEEPAAEVTEFLVYFAWDSAELSPLAQGFLDEVAQNARNAGVSDLFIGGHTDTSGPADYNVNLSLRRADSVADYLSARGLDRNGMTLEAFGETDLLVPTADGVREPNNRRVEIIFQ